MKAGLAGKPHDRYYSSDSKESACNAGDWDSISGLGRPPEKEMATHSSILAWKIPWTEEPGGIQSIESQTIGHDRVTNTFIHTRLPLYLRECKSRHKCSALITPIFSQCDSLPKWVKVRNNSFCSFSYAGPCPPKDLSYHEAHLLAIPCLRIGSTEALILLRVTT